MINTIRSGRHLGLALVVSLGVLLGADASLAATHIVTQSGFAFVPNDITIAQGDTVRWVYTSGVHTVTSGTGAADPDTGLLFDVPFNAGIFEYTFTAVGDVDYYCIPHEIFGMTGIVRVQAGGPAVPMLPGGPGLLLAALLLGSVPWMRKHLRERAAQA